MPALAEFRPPHPEGDALFCLDALIETDPAPARAVRSDGWTPDRQRRFLEMLAEGQTITNICRALGMSVASAYALRRSARGATFALGWQAALLRAREHLADRLLERAVHGSVDTITRPDGSTITRQRHDNRLAMRMLDRLDRLADSAHGAADHAAARLAAAEFDQYLDLVEQAGGPARAGLFLARRLAAAEAGADDLAPVRALARADAWLRGHADAAEGVAVADLDPAQRASWTAEQWARAEAAGLLVLAPPPAPDETAHTPKLPQLHDPDDPEDSENLPVWWSSYSEEWRTRFPPPADFCGEEEMEYGHPDYSRQLTEAEREALERPWRLEREARRAVEARERDAFFADEPDVPEGDATLDPPPPPPPPPAPPAVPRGPSDAPAEEAADGSRDAIPLPCAGGAGEGGAGAFLWQAQAQQAGAAAPC